MKADNDKRASAAMFVDAERTDGSRRELLAKLFAIAAGGTLVGCAMEQGGAANAEELGAAANALSAAATIYYVTDVASLRTTTVSAGISGVAVLAGWANPGDGGGGVFYWTTTAAVDDNGTFFNINGYAGTATSGWRRVYSGALNVKWFGATGTAMGSPPYTDDTTSIQIAVDAASAQRATLFVPAGVYGISDTIYVRSDTHIQGVASDYLSPGPGGQFGSIFRWLGEDDGTPMMAIDAATIQEFIHRVTLSDFALWGDKLTNATSLVGLLISGTGNHVVTNCKIERLGIGECATGIRWGDGAVGQADTFIVEQCEINYCSTYGIHIRSANAADATRFNCCRFTNVLPGAVDAIAIYIEKSGFLTIADTVCGSWGTFIKVATGHANVIRILGCETENVNRFLMCEGWARLIELDGNVINNAVELAGPAYIVATGNQIIGTLADETPYGLHMANASTWLGRGNYYDTTQGYSLTAATGAYFSEDAGAVKAQNWQYNVLDIANADADIRDQPFYADAFWLAITSTGGLMADRTVTLPATTAPAKFDIRHITIADLGHDIILKAGDGLGLTVTMKPNSSMFVLVQSNNVALTGPFVDSSYNVSINPPTGKLGFYTKDGSPRGLVGCDLAWIAS